VLGDQQQILASREPIIGWKVLDMHRWKLVSPQQRTVWESGQLAWDGECGCGFVERDDDHDSACLAPRVRPDQCLCGINAFKSLDELIEGAPELRLHGQELVVQVELSGQVRLYEKGYRAKRARVIQAWKLGAGRGHDKFAAKTCERAGVELAGRLAEHMEITTSSSWWTPSKTPSSSQHPWWVVAKALAANLFLITLAALAGYAILQSGWAGGSMFVVLLFAWLFWGVEAGNPCPYVKGASARCVKAADLVFGLSMLTPFLVSAMTIAPWLLWGRPQQ
jgi:hypothetical protein